MTGRLADLGADLLLAVVAALHEWDGFVSLTRASKALRALLLGAPQLARAMLSLRPEVRW